MRLLKLGGRSAKKVGEFSKEGRTRYLQLRKIALTLFRPCMSRARSRWLLTSSYGCKKLPWLINNTQSNLSSSGKGKSERKSWRDPFVYGYGAFPFHFHFSLFLWFRRSRRHRDRLVNFLAACRSSVLPHVEEPSTPLLFHSPTLACGHYEI